MKLRHVIGTLLLILAAGCGESSSPTEPALTCSYALSPTVQAASSAGGAFQAVMITTGSTCPWTAAADAPWIVITSGGSGTTGGTIAYSVAPDTGISREGAITARMGSQQIVLTVTQDGPTP